MTGFQNMPSSHAVRFHALVLAFYALIAFIALNPMIFNHTTHAAGFDYFHFHWNFWWVQHALETPGLNLYQSDYVLFPYTNNFSFHTLSLFWYPLWALLEPLTGTLTAMTVIIFVGCLLNGYVFFLLLRDLRVALPLALVFGAALQITPLVRYFYYNTHLNLMAWFWIPVHLLLWRHIVRAGTLRGKLAWAFVMGVGLWLMVLNDLQLPIFLAFLLVPYALWTLAVDTDRDDIVMDAGRASASPYTVHSNRRDAIFGVRGGDDTRNYRQRIVFLILAGILANAIALALLWFAGPLPYVLDFPGTGIPGRVEERPGIPFPRGYLSVDAVWWHWNVPTLGAFVAVMVVVGLIGWRYAGRVKCRERWLWFALLFPPLLISMGPTLAVGDTVIPLPYRLVFALTDGMFFMPWRIAPVYVIAGLVFAALSVETRMRNTDAPLRVPTHHRNSVGATRWVAQGEASPPPYTAQDFRSSDGPRLASPLRLTLSVVLMLFLAASLRLYQGGPVQPVAPVYDFYTMMGAEPYNYVVLEVPVAGGTGEVLIGDERAVELQYYGITHGKQMVNGFVARAPLNHFWHLNTDDPLLSWLGQRRALAPDVAAAELRRIVREWPVGYVVVHQDIIGIESPATREIIAFLNTLPDVVCPLLVERNTVLYRTTAHPDGCPPRIPPQDDTDAYHIDIGTSGDERFTGMGWYWRESIGGLSARWTGEHPQAALYLDLPPDSYEFTIAAQSFGRPRELTLRVNGQTIGTTTVSDDGLGTVTFSIPADVIGTGEHVAIVLDYEIPDTAPGGRDLALLVDWVELRPF